ELAVAPSWRAAARIEPRGLRVWHLLVGAARACGLLSTLLLSALLFPTLLLFALLLPTFLLPTFLLSARLLSHFFVFPALSPPILILPPTVRASLSILILSGLLIFAILSGLILLLALPGLILTSSLLIAVGLIAMLLLITALVAVVQLPAH